MNKEEIYKRIMVCEKKERDFLEVGNTRTANRYHNEIQKWEKLLDDLDCDREDYRQYKKGYISLQQRIDKAIEYIDKQIPIVKNEINIPNVNTAASELLNYEKLLETLKGE